MKKAVRKMYLCFLYDQLDEHLKTIGGVKDPGNAETAITEYLLNKISARGKKLFKKPATKKTANKKKKKKI